MPEVPTHPTAWTDVISYPLRYGVSPTTYAAKEAAIRKNLPAELGAIAQGNPNIEDRYIGQRIAAENSFWPEPFVKAANTFAFGDIALPVGEGAMTKAAGELGRQQGYQTVADQSAQDALGDVVKRRLMAKNEGGL